MLKFRFIRMKWAEETEMTAALQRKLYLDEEVVSIAIDGQDILVITKREFE